LQTPGQVQMLVEDGASFLQMQVVDGAMRGEQTAAYLATSVLF
jgi:hypothetical protein